MAGNEKPVTDIFKECYLIRADTITCGKACVPPTYGKKRKEKLVGGKARILPAFDKNVKRRVGQFKDEGNKALF